MQIRRRVSQCEGQNVAIAGTLAPDRESLVLQIQHRGAAGIESFQNLALGLDNFVRSAKLADVGGSSVGNDGNVWLGQAHGEGNFAHPRCTQFDDRRTVLGSQLQ